MESGGLGRGGICGRYGVEGGIPLGFVLLEYFSGRRQEGSWDSGGIDKPLGVIPDDPDVDEAAEIESLCSELGHGGWDIPYRGLKRSFLIFRFAATPDRAKCLLM